MSHRLPCPCDRSTESEIQYVIEGDGRSAVNAKVLGLNGIAIDGA